MDSLYETYLVRDQRMKIPEKLDLPVQKGSSDNTFQTVVANSTSSTQINFSFVPPSESVFIPRKVLLKATIQCVVNIVTPAGAGTPNGVNVFAIGQNVCLQSFPLHRLATSIQANINDAHLNNTSKDTLTAFLQMMDEKDMQEYQTGCPIMCDRYARYSDAVATNFNNPFLGYNQAYDKYNVPRGAYSIRVTNVSRNAGADNSLLKVADNDSWVITCEIDTVEPVLIPPFMSGKVGEEASALLGVNKIDITYLLDASGRRLFSSALSGTSATTFTTLVTNITNCELQMNYLSGDETALYPIRSVHPYYHFNPHTYTPGVAINNGANSQLTFNNLQLGEIPDLIALGVRKSYNNMSARDPEYTLPLSNISVTFNNRTTLLSNTSVDQLYLMSKRNGLKNVDYHQFRGFTQIFNAGYVAGANGASNTLYTAGSYILLNPSKDLSFSNAFISNCSTGQFNFSFNCTATNNSGFNIASVEMVVVLIYKRLLTTSAGKSSVKEPAFTMQTVQQTIDSRKEAVEPANEQSMLLGGMKRGRIVAKGVSGGARSGGMNKLDALVI